MGRLNLGTSLGIRYKSSVRGFCPCSGLFNMPSWLTYTAPANRTARTTWSTMLRGIVANQAVGVIIPNPLTTNGFYGLQLEPAATNYVLYSENFAQWTNFNSQATINGTGIIDPAGGTTAYDISVGAGLTGLYSPSVYSGTNQTVSAWLNAYSGAGAGASTGAVVIEGENGYITTGYQGLPYPTAAKTTWGRFWISQVNFNLSSVQTAIGDRASAFPSINTRAQYAFIQVETTPYPTSYIPTTSSTASRATTTLAWTPFKSDGTFNIILTFAMSLPTSTLAILGTGFTLLSDSTGTKTIGVNSSGKITSTLGNTVTDATPLSWADGDILEVQIIANGPAKTYTANISTRSLVAPYTPSQHSFIGTHSSTFNMGSTIYIGSSPTGTNMIPVDGLLGINEQLGSEIF